MSRSVSSHMVILAVDKLSIGRITRFGRNGVDVNTKRGYCVYMMNARQTAVLTMVMYRSEGRSLSDIAAIHDVYREGYEASDEQEAVDNHITAMLFAAGYEGSL